MMQMLFILISVILLNIYSQDVICYDKFLSHATKKLSIIKGGGGTKVSALLPNQQLTLK